MDATQTGFKISFNEGILVSGKSLSGVEVNRQLRGLHL